MLDCLTATQNYHVQMKENCLFLTVQISYCHKREITVMSRVFNNNLLKQPAGLNRVTDCSCQSPSFKEVWRHALPENLGISKPLIAISSFEGTKLSTNKCVFHSRKYTCSFHAGFTSTQSIITSLQAVDKCQYSKLRTFACIMKVSGIF